MTHYKMKIKNKKIPVAPLQQKWSVKKGMTLVELMIAITIVTIGMGGFTLLFANTWRINSYTLEMGRSSIIVSQGLSKMVSHIRGARQADNGAYPIKSADDNDLVIYSDYDKDGITERIHLYKNGQNIIMGITLPGGTIPVTYQAGDQETITIANSIVNTAAEPIFFYFDKDFGGDETANPPLSTPANISDIRLIKIHLKINIDPNRAPDNIEMQSFVEIRNLNDYDRLK